MVFLLACCVGSFCAFMYCRKKKKAKKAKKNREDRSRIMDKIDERISLINGKCYFLPTGASRNLLEQDMSLSVQFKKKIPDNAPRGPLPAQHQVHQQPAAAPGSGVPIMLQQPATPMIQMQPMIPVDSPARVLPFSLPYNLG